VPVLLELRATASFLTTDTRAVGVEALVQVTPASPGLVLATVTIPAGLPDQLRPALNGVTQRVFLRITADGIPGEGTITLLEHELSSGGWSLDETLDGGSGWTFALPASTGEWVRNTLGYETDWNAPPPGPNDVHFAIVYVIGGTEYSYPIVSGKSTSSRRTFDAEDGHVMELSGLGPEGCFDGVRVSYALAPSHGKTHGEMISEIAVLMGVPAANIGVGASLGAPRTRALDVICEEGWSVIQEIADAIGHVVIFDENSVLQAVPRAPATGSASATLDIGDIEAGSGFQSDGDADIATIFEFSGTSPQLPDTAEGNVTKESVIESYADYAVPGAVTYQDGAGTVAAVSGTPGDLDSKFQLVSRVTTREIYRAGCLVADETITESWFAPESYRYTIDTAGAIATYKSNGYFYESGVVKDDSNQAYWWRYFRFVEISRVRNEYTYGTGGVLFQVDTYYSGWLNREAALKSRANPSTTWESTLFVNATKVTGDGRGVVLETEHYFKGPFDPEDAGLPPVVASDLVSLTASTYARHDLKEITNSGLNFVIDEDVRNGEWFLDPGDLKLFHGERTSSADTSIGDIKGRTLTTYDAFQSGNRKVIVSKFDSKGSLTGQTITTEDDYLPAATVCSQDNLERSNAAPIEVKYLFGNGCAKTESFSNDFVETLEEAEDYLRMQVRLITAPTVTVGVMVNASLKRSDEVMLNLPRLGIVGVHWVESVSHAKEGQDDAALSVVKLRRPLL